MNVLVADDDAVSRFFLQKLLQSAGYNVITATDGLQAWSILNQLDAPRLVIVDWMMPGMDGVEIIRRLREEARQFYTYVMLLTAKSDKQEILHGMAAGVDDYLVKPVDADQLAARLMVGKRILELQDRLVAACEQATFQADHDALTSLLNRAAILKVLHREIVRAERDHSPIAALMIDIDHFKRVNDTHGHFAGDFALQAVARVLTSNVREYDSVGRFGGEEFVVIAPDCEPHEALRLAERLRTAVANERIHVGVAEISPTISIGVSARTDCDPESLLRDADDALYSAKHNGRNRVEVSSTALPLDLGDCAQSATPRSRP